jgi:hypothetical protein
MCWHLTAYVHDNNQTRYFGSFHTALTIVSSLRKDCH